MHNSDPEIPPFGAIWMDGEFVFWKDIEPPLIAFGDRLRLGQGVFDTLKAVDGEVHYLDRHIERLFRHAAVLDIRPWLSPADLESAVDSVIVQNGLAFGRTPINILMTKGWTDQRGLRAAKDMQATIIIAHGQDDLPETYPPLRMGIATCTRRNEFSPLSRIKSVQYADNILAVNEVTGRGADSAILLNTRGLVACAVNGNIFVRQGGALYTPPLVNGAMDGIIRDLLLERDDVYERSLFPSDLFEADAVIVTNSLSGLRPVAEIDGKTTPWSSEILDHYALPCPLTRPLRVAS